MDHFAGPLGGTSKLQKGRESQDKDKGKGKGGQGRAKGFFSFPWAPLWLWLCGDRRADEVFRVARAQANKDEEGVEGGKKKARRGSA